MGNLGTLPLFNTGEELTGIETIHVNVKNAPYDIYVGGGMLSKINYLWKKLKLSSQVLIVSDPVVFELYGKKLIDNFSFLGIEPFVHCVAQGEASKNPEEIFKIYDILVANKYSRDCVIVAFGGGVIGDLTGFAAATYMRGVNLIQIPTTLLAQVDSSIGGKTAINHKYGKNLIGSFYQPKAVIIDVDVLATLPERELRTGLAEVIKYGVIEDQSFFDYLSRNKDKLGVYQPENKTIWIKIILTSCKAKAKIVTIDEREQGLRAILNYGHTIGHAIETITDYKKYNHGEAVAIGMVGAAIIAKNRGLVDPDVVMRISNLAKYLGLPVEVKGYDASEIINILKLDKKVKEGKVHFILPKRIGLVEDFADITNNEIMKALKELEGTK